MRDLLFLAHRLPWPPDKGERIRSWHVLAHLARRFRIHLGCPSDDPAELEHLPRLRDICASVGVFPVPGRRAQIRHALLRARPGQPLMPGVYHAAALQRWTDETIARHRPAILHVNSVAMAPYVLATGHAAIVLDAQDIDSEKWREYGERARSPMRLVWSREARTLLGLERRAAAAAAATLFVSQPEAARFLELAPEAAGRVHAIENGVDLERFSPATPHPNPLTGPGPHLVFTGHMDYPPNIDAVAWFADDILPALRARHPDLAFWIVGANPAAAVRALATRPGVHVTGRVPDTRPYLAHATIAVAPLRIARGIQNKVLEALAMGRPTLASEPAWRGIRAEPGRDLLVAADALGLIDEALAILAGAHTSLGTNARAAMERHYAWDAVLAPLDELTDRMAGLPPAPAGA